MTEESHRRRHGADPLLPQTDDADVSPTGDADGSAPIGGSASEGMDAFRPLLEEPDAGEGPRGRRAARSRQVKRRRRRIGVLIALIAVVVIAAMGVGAATFLQGPIASLLAASEPDEYSGEGTGSATIVIATGDYGSDVAAKLEDAGVVKSSSSFTKYLLSLSTQPTFQPGTYQLKQQMSNSAALAALEDDANRVTRSVTIPEGYTVDQIFEKLEAIGFDADDLETLRADPSSLGVPEGAISLEGFLFPATYQFDPDTTAEEALQTMVDRTMESLDSLGVPEADRLSTIILASIIQKEAGSVDDMAKVSRVFLNRIAAGMKLQSDATVAYGAGSSGTVWTTSSERADESNIYNTYVHEGLPPGAISNPGDDAISAAVNPAVGDWLYFTVVDLSTGETVFSEDEAGHEAAVEQLSQWCQASTENAQYCQ